MIKEAYVSFETAKLLKEKGFDAPCYGRYSVRSQEFHLDTTRPCNNGGISQYSAPTHQMAMAWLREVKIDIAIYPYGNYSSENYQFDVYKNRHLIVSKDDGYVTYEQAVEAALKYCLENLI